MKVLITQRESHDAYGEPIDVLEGRYVTYFARLGIWVQPVSNFLPVGEESLCGGSFEGLTLTGGGTLPPALYRTPPKEQTQPHRDEVERFLIEHCRQRGKPILAICRGMQYLNGLFGGKIARLDALPVPRPVRVDHPVSVAGEAWLVNQYHDDGILLEDLAPGLKPLAVDEENGIVEAFTVPGERILALQWHPERPFASAEAGQKTAELIRKFFCLGDVEG